MNPLERFQPKFNLKQIGSQNFLYYDIPKIKIAELRSPFEQYQTTLKELLISDELCIPLSGGIDSESLFLAAIAANVSFKPIIVRFQDDMNNFDIIHAIEICKLYGKEPIILNLNLDDFYFSGKHLYYAHQYKCRSPQLAVHLWMMEQTSGAFIFPHNPVPIFRAQNKKMYIGFPPDLYSCYNIFFEKNNRPGISYFSICTPEILYSYLKLPIYLNALFDDNYFRIFTSEDYSFKSEIYRQAGFKSKPKKNKATGFEKYRSYLNKKYSSEGLINKGNDYYDMNFRKPMELIVNDPCYIATGNIDIELLYKFYSP